MSVAIADHAAAGAPDARAALPLALTFAQVWACYRRYEYLLPPQPEVIATERVAGLEPLLARYDAFVFDAYGVLNCGTLPIPGAADAFAAACATGKPVVVLTNDASGDRDALIAKHGARGFDLRGTRIIAGVDLLPDALSAHADAGHFGYLGPAPRPRPEVTGELADLGDASVSPDDVAGFVLLEHPAWDLDFQTRLTASLAARPRPLLIGNPDITAPSGGLFTVEPGYLGLQMALRAGIRPQLLGKPNPAVYAALLSALPGVAPERVLAIGDSPHTDVLGARSAGLHTLLVESGILARQHSARLLADAGIHPHYIAAHI